MDRYTAVFPALSESETVEHLQLLIENALQNKIGNADDTQIQKRIHEEWGAMERYNMISAVAALYDLTTWLKSKSYPYRMKYAAGSSLILYLLGITSGNPLPPDFNGFDIPWQILWGYGNSYATLKISLPATHYQEVQETIHVILNKRFLSGNQCQTKISGQGIREIDMSDIVLCFELKDSTVAPEFYEQRITPSDYMAFIGNWEHYISYEFMQRNELPWPANMADLITLRGLGSAAGAVNKETARLITTHGISSMIAFRDDIYGYLLSHGFSEEEAWKGAKSVGCGRGLPFITDEMEVAPDRWKLLQCKSIRYLPSKAEIMESLIYEYKKSIQID